MTSVIVVGKMSIDPGKLDEFLQEVEKLEELTRKEDGCLTYAMALDDYATAQVAVVERWRDEAALRTHLGTDQVKAFIERCGPMILSMDAKLYDAVNERNVM